MDLGLKTPLWLRVTGPGREGREGGDGGDDEAGLGCGAAGSWAAGDKAGWGSTGREGDEARSGAVAGPVDWGEGE